MNAREIVGQARHLLLDFDGPVCAVFGGIPDHEAADALRAELAAGGVPIPDEVARSRDPFDVLGFAAQIDERTAERIEWRFRECEVEAIQEAPATEGAAELLKRAAVAGQLVTIVSNNSTTAVRQYLEQRGLTQFVRGVSARDGAVVERLKPSPFLLLQAMDAAGTSPAESVMIGDSMTDVEAARAAGTKAIAYANKPGKRERFAALLPDAVVDTMAEL